MNLRKILSIIGLSLLLPNCATVRGYGDESPIKFDKKISVEINGKILDIGHDTDNDEFSDYIEEYYGMASSEDEKSFYYELAKIYEDKNRNHKIDTDELIWKEGDKMTDEMSKKKSLFLGFNDRFMTIGYSTKDDNNEMIFEDIRGNYKIVAIIKSKKIFLLEKDSVYQDKNNNLLFEKDECIEKEEVTPEDNILPDPNNFTI